MTLVRLENTNEIVRVSEDDIKEAGYFEDLKYLDIEKQKEFKKLFGIDLNKHIEEDIYSLKEELDDDMQDEFDYFVSDLPYVKTACDGIYCENIILKEDIEDLEGDVVFLNSDYLVNSISEIADDKFFIHFDGSNYRAYKIEEIYEIVCDECDDDEFDCDDNCDMRDGTYHYEYYKTETGKKFRLFCSHYQGTLDILDEDCEDGLQILESE